MKKEILTLIIGFLIGAITATGIFLVLDSKEGSNDFSGVEMNSERPETDGEMGKGFMGGEELPEDSNTTSTDDTTNNL